MGDAESMIRYGGLLIIFLAVFCQTGLFFCFFIPSGGLMFTAGVWVASGDLHSSLSVVCGLLVLASCLGNVTGYCIGRKAGPLLFTRRPSRFFKPHYLASAETFYRKHGKIALTAGLFLPIIRTFSPVVAGMIKLDIRSFLFFTFLGSLLWIGSFVGAGYLVGTMPLLKPYLPYVVGGILLLVTLPLVVSILRKLRS